VAFSSISRNSRYQLRARNGRSEGAFDRRDRGLDPPPLVVGVAVHPGLVGMIERPVNPVFDQRSDAVRPRSSRNLLSS